MSSNFVRILIAIIAVIGWCFVFIPWTGITGTPNILLSAVVGAALTNWVIWSWR